jgi:hypothetical protein
MNVSAFSSFEGVDFGAFVICGLLGYLVGSFAPSGPPAIYTSVLVSYHLFLAWLIFLRKSDKRAGVSLSVVQTILTHAACLALIVGPVAVALHSVQYLWTPHQDDAMNAYNTYRATRRAVRLVEGLCCSLAGFAVFERQWLFTNESSEPKPQPVLATPPLTVRATPEDTAEWNRYVAANRKSFPPGANLKTEYEKWLTARHSSRNTGQTGV